MEQCQVPPHFRTYLTLGTWNQQFVGLELIRAARLASPERQVRFWRDPDGPEVDWVVVAEDKLLPIEVKWNEAPTERDARHLEVFMAEHKAAATGLIVCRTPRRFKVSARVTAVPWTEISEAVEALV